VQGFERPADQTGRYDFFSESFLWQVWPWLRRIVLDDASVYDKSPARSGCMMRSADCMAATNTVIARHAYGRICRGHHLALSETRTVNRSFAVDACLTASAVDTLLCLRIRGFVSFCVLPDDTLRHRGAWFCRAGRLCCDPLKLRHSGPGLGYEVCVADHGRSWAIDAGESH